MVVLAGLKFLMSEVPLYPPQWWLCSAEAPLKGKAEQERQDSSQDEDKYTTEMCGGSEAGSYLRLIDFVFHSQLKA